MLLTFILLHFCFLFLCCSGQTDPTFQRLVISRHSATKQNLLAQMKAKSVIEGKRRPSLEGSGASAHTQNNIVKMKLGLTQGCIYVHTRAPFHVRVHGACSLQQSLWIGTGFSGRTHASSCKAAAVQSLLVEQLTVHTNINVWKCARSATEPNRIPVSGVEMLIETRQKYPVCELRGKERKSLRVGSEKILLLRKRTTKNQPLQPPPSTISF